MSKETKESILDYVNKVGTRLARQGDTIFSQGQRSDGCMFFLFEGDLSIRQKIGDLEQEISVVKPGDFFGEIALIKNVPRTGTAVVVSNTARVAVIDREIFLRISRSEPGFMFILLKTAIERLLKAEKRMEA